MKIRIANIIEESIVDGDGVQFVVFVQGCPHKCKGCHNPTTHDFNSGELIDTQKIIARFRKAQLISGITLTGGEPLCQIPAVTELAKAAKIVDLSVWCYTGYAYEKICNNADVKQLLRYIDVLLDGAFIESQRDLTLRFRGSRNQRLINIPESLAQNKVIMLSEQI